MGEGPKNQQGSGKNNRDNEIYRKYLVLEVQKVLAGWIEVRNTVIERVNTIHT